MLEKVHVAISKFKNALVDYLSFNDIKRRKFASVTILNYFLDVFFSN